MIEAIGTLPIAADEKAIQQEATEQERCHPDPPGHAGTERPARIREALRITQLLAPARTRSTNCCGA